MKRATMHDFQAWILTREGSSFYHGMIENLEAYRGAHPGKYEHVDRAVNDVRALVYGVGNVAMPDAMPRQFKFKDDFIGPIAHYIAALNPGRYEIELSGLHWHGDVEGKEMWETWLVGQAFAAAVLTVEL